MIIGKKSYLDIHASWIDNDFSYHHAALAVKHFGTEALGTTNEESTQNQIFISIPDPIQPNLAGKGVETFHPLRGQMQSNRICDFGAPKVRFAVQNCDDRFNVRPLRGKAGSSADVDEPATCLEVSQVHQTWYLSIF